MNDSIIFSSGRLLLPTEIPDGTVQGVIDTPMTTPIIVVAMLLILALFLSNILNAIPAVLSSFTRYRGLSDLEGSVRLVRDRNITAVLLILPFCLMVNKTGMYTPEILNFIQPDLRPLAVAAAFLAFLFLRLIVYMWIRPSGGYDSYVLARRSGWNTFIVTVILMLAVFGTASFFDTNELTLRTILFSILGVSYLAHLIRLLRFLSSHCGAFTTFLYLCALEIIPTGLLIASAIVL